MTAKLDQILISNISVRAKSLNQQAQPKANYIEKIKSKWFYYCLFELKKSADLPKAIENTIAKYCLHQC